MRDLYHSNDARKVIGVIGYSTNSCKTEKARDLVAEGIAEAATQLGVEISPQTVIICSGLTNLGIPALAYEFAFQHELKTMGVACPKAYEHSVYPVDEKLIFGENWGDESAVFLDQLDALVRVGGGEQSEKEAKIWLRAQELIKERRPEYIPAPYIYKELTREGT